MGPISAPTPRHRFTPRWLSAALLALAGVLGGPTALTRATEPTLERASVSTGGVQGNGDSGQPSVSGDGRLVAFASSATNLVPNDTNRKQDIFVHDRHTGITTRVSVSSTGAEASGESSAPSLSADGRVVVFVSAAANLVPGDMNKKKDIYAHDRVTGETTRISVSSSGQEANADSVAPVVSVDGRFVAFESAATNLVPGDTNKMTDVFVHDRVTGETTRVSVSSADDAGNGHSRAPAISGDGQIVAFESQATNLVPGGDVNKKKRDVFVRDRVAGQTTRVSVSNVGVQGDKDSVAPVLSANGRYIAFESAATTFVLDDTNKRKDIFLHDRVTGETTRLSVGAAEQADKDSRHPAISGDGRMVAFESAATTLIEDDTNKKTDIFVHDRQAGTVTRVAGPDPGEPNQHSTDAALSTAGSVLVFASKSTNLALPDGNRKMDVFVFIVGGGPPANTPPVAVDDPASTADDQPVTVAVLANDTDADGDTLSVTGVGQSTHGTVTFTAANVTFTPTAGFEGAATFGYTIGDGHGGSASATVTVTVTRNRAPTVSAGTAVTITLPAGAALDGTVTDDGLPSPPATVTTGWSKRSGPGTVTFGDAAAIDTSASFSEAGTYVLRLTASDNVLSAFAEVTITVNPVGGGGGGLPPDPSTVAPALDPTVASTIGTGTEFLYTGPNPIQTGVAPGTINPVRAAVIRGTVRTRSNQPLSGVTLTILGHPEFGQTLSRADGMFDMAINGGGALTITYTKAGYFTAQRQVNAPWQDFVMASDVVLVQADPQVSTVDLTSPALMQVARGSVQTDADGTRQATLLFPQGTTAMMVMPDGATQSLTSLHVRATEYTVGANGPQAMPAELPPTSGYTYAVELSVDEALTVGATRVNFNPPIPFYVENFLGFPVATKVPLGSYDAARGVWLPADSGRVLRIVGITGGKADLDVDGDGLVDGGTLLAALAITDAERQQLATLYQPGRSLWRVLIPHFSPMDLNWGIGPPPGAKPPDKDPTRDKPLDAPCVQAGNSIITCQNQSLGEALRVIGTPFGLHYQSERVPGRKVAYHVNIPLSGDLLPPGVRQIELEIFVAGRRLTETFPPNPNQQTTFTWDGQDAYGRALQGTQPVTVRIGYTYGAVYRTAARFGDSAGNAITESQARREVTLWRTWQDHIGIWNARAAGLAGWTLSAQHTYDPGDHVLYRGDGRHESARALGPTIGTVAGTGTIDGSDADGGLATQEPVAPQGLAVAPDGSLYIANTLLRNVRRVSPNGIITTVAGNANDCSSSTASAGDGGPALQAQLSAWSIAVGSDTSLYIGDLCTGRVRKVGPDGIITTIAGTGVAGFSGDGGPGPLAQIHQPLGLAVGQDHAVYIADTLNFRVRRVGPDGIITTIAGNGSGCFAPTGGCGDGGPATLAQLSPSGVAVGRDGSVYIADNAGRVRRVTPDGIITTIAGNGTAGFSGDGGPAIAASFHTPSAVALGPDDTIYVVDQQNRRIRWLRLGGPIFTLTGTGISATSGDGGLASRAELQDIEYGLAVGPDGSVYVSQSHNNVRVRKISPIGAGELSIPSADGREVYQFTPTWRHLRTMDALTGALRSQFAYDGAGRLATVTDVDGNVTSIERESAGNPTAIIGPFGQRTTLAINADGYLTRLTSPTGDAVQLAYTADGLLTGFTKPGGQLSLYSYDTRGRLTRATDPTGAAKTLTRTGTDEDYTVALTSALGRTTTYRVERLSTGGIGLTTTDPAGAQRQAVLGQNGVQTATTPDGTTVTVVLGPDPRWGMRAPLAARVTMTTPGGKVQSTTTQRTVTLATPGDLLSLRTSSETVTINGQAFTTAYDAPSRTITRTSPTGRRASAIIDARGRPVQEVFGGLAPSSYTSDARGRLATATQGQGAASRTLTLAYGGDGFLASVTDAIDRTLAFTRDANGRITDQTHPDGGLARFVYDANGNVIAQTPPARPDHTSTYTVRNQVSVYTAPLVGAENNQTGYGYDADRHRIRIDRPDGQSVGFQYDSAGRLALLDLASDDRSYTYDTAGRLSTLSTPALSLAYAYDGSLLTSTTWSGAVTGSVTRAFDNNFRVISRSVNGNNPIALPYDQDGLPAQVGDLTLTRDAQTGLITATTLGALSDSVSSDGFGAMANYVASHGGSAVYAAAYTRDLLGRLTTKTETLGGTTRVFSYTYDRAGRLSEVRQDGVLTASYTYDTNGNRLSRTDAGGTINAAYDAQDRLDEYGSTTYAHNPNGERHTTTTGAVITSYQYDGLGNLIGVTVPGGTHIEYLLDGQERRIGKKVDGTLVQGFLYQDGLRPIAELDGAGNVVSRFVYATRFNVPAYMVKGGTTYRIITDHLGSPRLVLDIATGQITQRMDHDEFGRVTLDTNPGFQPFGFAGGLSDQRTGLVHFGAREYDPETGRWTTKDPIGFAGGDGNLYAYVGNEPVNNVDSKGLCLDSVTCTCARNPALCVEAGIEAAGGGAAAAGGAAAGGGAAAAGGATVATEAAAFCEAGGAAVGAKVVGGGGVVAGEVLGGGGVFAQTALVIEVAETVATGTATYSGLTVAQLTWVQRMATLLGLAAKRIEAYEAGNAAELDRIAARWSTLFRLARGIR